MGRTGKMLLVLWLVTLAAMAAGVVLVWKMPAPSRSGCSGPPKGATMDHLARCDHGVTISASTTDRGGGHDAAFLIDGRIGSDTEKWVSAEGDGSPRVTLEWDRPIRTSRITLHHAGLREDPGYNTRAFLLEARVDGKWVPLAHVTNNAMNASAHIFKEVTTDSVRISVESPAVNGNGRARLYEVEVK